MEIRKSTLSDKNIIIDIFDIAKKYMTNHNNETQWVEGYPSGKIIENDINNGNSYLLVDNNEIVGTFSFIIGEEETYKTIHNGKWDSDKIYGTIHRLASRGKTKGIAKACFDYCISKMDYVRIDTHLNNLTMKNAILKYGFKECGIINVRDNSIRIAYDFLKNR